MFSRTLIANDGPEGAARALSAAIEPARKHAAEPHVIRIEESACLPAPVGAVIEEEAEADHGFAAAPERARGRAQAAGARLATRVVVGHRVPAIVAFIVAFVEREHCDLLVSGCMGIRRCTTP